MASTPPTFRTSITDGGSEPTVSATWTSLNDAVISFLEMCDSIDAPLGRFQFKILLVLFLSGSPNQRFQLLSADTETVVLIERIQAVGIPTTSER